MATRVLTVIGARLNSSRLPGKHLLDLAGKCLLARLYDRLALVPCIDLAVVATTADSYNQPLVDWAVDAGVPVAAYPGDVNDLVGRVDWLVRQHEPEVVVYVCGDSPLIDPIVLNGMIQAVLAHPDHDVAQLQLEAGAQSIHVGFSVYRRSFWDRIVATSHEPYEREHVGVVYGHLNKVSPRAIAWYRDDPVFASSQQRISVDTPSDYAFMHTVYHDWYAGHAADSIVDLKWMIAQLKERPDLVAMNANVRQKGIHEASRRIVIIADCRPMQGLGHLRRAAYTADILRDALAAKVEVLTVGPLPSGFDLGYTHHTDHTEWNVAAVEAFLGEASPELLIFDMASPPGGLAGLLASCRKSGIKTMGIDRMVYVDGMDAYFVPSFHVAAAQLARRAGKIRYGWDCYLLPVVRRSVPVARPRNIVVLTGGSDVANMGAVLPAIIDAALPPDIQLTWLKGPHALPPRIEEVEHADRWTIWRPEGQIAPELWQFDAAITLFGMSFFECLAAALPSVVLDPIGALEPDAWEPFKASGAGLLCEELGEIPGALIRLADGWRPDVQLTDRLTEQRGIQMVDQVRGLLG